jgi:hypothetical protein
MKASQLRRVLVAKATVFVGLAMLVAVVLGAASTALAADGDFFKIGRNNKASSVSTLTKSGTGPALSLNVGSGGPPLAVNSNARVTNLNADQLDGAEASSFLPANGKAVDADKLDGLDSRAFLKSGIYVRGGESETFGTPLPDGKRKIEAHCLTGDLPLGGGIANVDTGTHVLSSFPELRFSPPGWVVSIQNDGTLDAVSAVVRCANQ